MSFEQDPPAGYQTDQTGPSLSFDPGLQEHRGLCFDTVGPSESLLFTSLTSKQRGTPSRGHHIVITGYLGPRYDVTPAMTSECLL